MRLARLAYLALLAIALAAPLPLGGNRPAAAATLALAIALVLLVWCAAATVRPATLAVGWRHFRVPAGCFVLLTAWFLLQASSLAPAAWQHPLWAEARAALGQPLAGAIGAAPRETLAATMRWLAYGAVFFLAMQAAANERHARLALATIGFAGGVQALYACGLWLAGSEHILWLDKWAYLGSATGTFVNRNHFASYLGLSALCLLAWQVLPPPPVWRRLALALLAPIGLALLLSHSRAGLAATAVGLGVFVLLRRSAGRRLDAPWLAIAAGALALAAVFGGATFARLEATGREDLVDRLALHGAALEGVRARPWLGHGLGSFESAFAAWRVPALAALPTIDHAHNEYLEWAFEAGLPATALLAAMFVAILAPTWRAARAGDATAQAAVAAVALSAAHAAVDFPLQIPAVAIAFALIVGSGFGRAALLPKQVL